MKVRAKSEEFTKKQDSIASKAAKIIAKYSGNNYVAYHSQRYAVLLNILTKYITSERYAVLDIGRSTLTALIGSEFGINIDTLGFADDELTEMGQHYQFDLNHSQWQEKWRTDLPQYDIIVMAEVIEHLYTSPTLVLSFLKTLLKPEGVLIIQTPNALAFWKRIKPLLGIHPYELIREDCSNPGHYREYTKQELYSYAEATEFSVFDCIHCSYFDYRYLSRGGQKLAPVYVGAIANFIYGYLPKALKTGITIVLTPKHKNTEVEIN
jgi:SAM-dependent methyltransferase